MTFSGFLSEYSLAENFNFISEANRTGLLTISSSKKNDDASSSIYYLWFKHGRIIAVTTRLDGTELLIAIGKRSAILPASINVSTPQNRELMEVLRMYLQSLDAIAAKRVVKLFQQLSQPLGLYLKSQNLMDTEQLTLLFNNQTVTMVCKIFQVTSTSTDATDSWQFNFDPNQLPMNAEIIGISLTAQEMGLRGLRFLKDWHSLRAKLPDSDYTIQQLSPQPPTVRLDRNELLLWQLADGKTSLTKLALKMKLSIEVVQQISFRLSCFQLVKEIPPVSQQFDDSTIEPNFVRPVGAAASGNDRVSASLLNKLKGFLKGSVKPK